MASVDSLLFTLTLFTALGCGLMAGFFFAFSVSVMKALARLPHAQAPIPYSAAKAGIQILTQVVAAQVGPYGVRSNCIAPETILTERNEQRIPDAQKQALLDRHPIKRLGIPEDVARAALFLASDDAAWITGTVLDIAGGAVMA